MSNSTDPLELVFKFSADPNNGGTKRYGPILRTLHDASYEKFVSFLDHGADPIFTNNKGKTILQVVLELGPALVVLGAELVRLLIK
jgi:hypothetical protein